MRRFRGSRGCPAQPRKPMLPHRVNNLWDAPRKTSGASKQLRNSVGSIRGDGALPMKSQGSLHAPPGFEQGIRHLTPIGQQERTSCAMRRMSKNGVADLDRRGGDPQPLRRLPAANL